MKGFMEKNTYKEIFFTVELWLNPEAGYNLR